jgi:SET domain-containing protein
MQKRILHFTSKIEVRESQIEGWGVFAKEKILKGEILEESPFVVLPNWILAGKPLFEVLKQHNLTNPKEKYITNLAKNLGFKDSEEYYFKWMPKYQPDEEEIVYTVLPLGFGPIYNSSNSGNNAEWKINEKTFVFSASKDIEKDEEICTFYGYFLDEDGTKFECDDVYNLGLDYFNNIVGFKSIRFGNIKSHLSALNNPFYAELTSLLKNTKSPIFIKKITALSALGKEEASIDIPKNVSLKNLFNKLKECKSSSFPQIRFIFEYLDKESLLNKELEITWKR